MADAQELLAWRVQRSSIALSAISAVALLVQGFGIGSPQVAL